MNEWTYQLSQVKERKVKKKKKGERIKGLSRETFVFHTAYLAELSR